MLDGTTLTVGGVFDSFITDYIESLYSSNPERFTTEELWQESVSNYGVCAKYVYTQGVSVRLPKITGFIEGTLDPAALGEIVEAGLPNISQTFTAPGNQNLDDSTLVNITLGGQSVSSYPPLNSTSKENSTWDIDFSRANPIYGNSTTVQPQSIKGYFYIVVATGTKTQTQIDIDNITTDLNTKADTDLTNTTPAQSFKNESMLWTTPDFANIITMNMTTTQSEFVAPSHGWIIWALCGSKGITGDVYVNGICVGGGGGEASSTPALSTLSFSGICPVAKDDVVKYRSTRATMPDYPEYYYFKFVPMKGVQE